VESFILWAQNVMLFLKMFIDLSKLTIPNVSSVVSTDSLGSLSTRNIKIFLISPSLEYRNV